MESKRIMLAREILNTDKGKGKSHGARVITYAEASSVLMKVV